MSGAVIHVKIYFRFDTTAHLHRCAVDSFATTHEMYYSHLSELFITIYRCFQWVSFTRPGKLLERLLQKAVSENHRNEIGYVISFAQSARMRILTADLTGCVPTSPAVICTILSRLRSLSPFFFFFLGA